MARWTTDLADALLRRHRRVAQIREDEFRALGAAVDAAAAENVGWGLPSSLRTAADAAAAAAAAAA